MAQYKMIIDTEKCMNCGACIVGCQQRNATTYGHRRNWVREIKDDKKPGGKVFQPGGCMQCAEPLCVDACPTRATYKDADGVIVVDKTRCIGCGACVAACPYGARYRDERLGVADKCDYCATTRPLGMAPACVQLCPTKARVFGDLSKPDDPVAKLAGAANLSVVESTAVPTKPTLAYIGDPGDKVWPSDAKLPLPIALMGPLATGVRWLGGLSLLGIVGVFLKNLAAPADENKHAPEEKSKGADAGKGGQQ